MSISVSRILRHGQSVEFTKTCGVLETLVGPTVRTCSFGVLSPSFESKPLTCKSL